MNEFIKFLVAGVLNTLLGYCIFWILWKWAGFSPEGANAIGYITALFLAFILNRFFVFSGSVITATAVARFIASFGIAFASNQGVLFVLFRIFFVTPEIAQLFAMVAYTIIFYLLNKWFVFSISYKKK